MIRFCEGRSLSTYRLNTLPDLLQPVHVRVLHRREEVLHLDDEEGVQLLLRLEHAGEVGAGKLYRGDLLRHLSKLTDRSYLVERGCKFE